MGAEQVFGHAGRRGVATAPSVRSTFGATTASATALAATLPSGIQNGDIGVVVATTDPNATLATPAGWTKLDSRKEDEGTGLVVTYVWSKPLTTADSSTTVTATRSAASAPITVVGVVVKDGGEIGVALRLGREALSVNPSGKTTNFPAIKPGPQDLVLAVGGARNYASLAATASKIVTPPTSFTIQENRSAQAVAGLSVAYAAWICSGAAADANLTALTAVLNDQSLMVGGLLSISPAGRRGTDKLPASLSNAAIHGYGTSYMGYAVDALGHSAEAPFYHRIARRMGTPTEDNNMALLGAQASDICGHAFGTVSTYYTRAAQSDTNFTLQQIGTWMSQATRSGLVLLDLFGNDAIRHADTDSGGTTAKSLAGARAAGESLVRLLRASSMVQQSDASVVFTGTWSDVAAVDYSGGSCKGTTTAGDKATITVTQTDIDVVLFAIDDAALTQVGAGYQVKVDGVTVASGTTSDRMRRSSSTTYRRAAYCQLCIPCRDMGPGSHTIEIIHAGVNGQGLYFDGYLVVSATPPIVVLNKLASYDDTVLTGLTPASSNAIFAQYSQIAADIAALFPDGKVLAYDPLASGLWSHTTMVTAYDNIHLNDVGTAFYASGILKLLSETVA